MKEYTLADVKTHDKKDDCWIVINDKVYDVTEFLGDHPGGSSILLTVGGKDASDYFWELHRSEILDEIAQDYEIGYILKTANL